MFKFKLVTNCSEDGPIALGSYVQGPNIEHTRGFVVVVVFVACCCLFVRFVLFCFLSQTVWVCGLTLEWCFDENNILVSSTEISLHYSIHLIILAMSARFPQCSVFGEFPLHK